jgi:hypothetical protein
VYEDILPDDFECLIGVPDDACGAINGKIRYNPPDYSCQVCGLILHTETDIEADTDSDYTPAGDGRDGDDEDDGEDADMAPVSQEEKESSPREQMAAAAYKTIRGVIDEMLESDNPSYNAYVTFLANNIDELVSFYMLFTKYGPYAVIERPSSLSLAIMQCTVAYMMMEEKQVRFTALADFLGVREKELLSVAIQHIETHKGEEYEKGVYLMEVYYREIGLPENFLRPARQLWPRISQPIGALLDRIVAYLAAYGRANGINLTVSAVSRSTSISRATLGRLIDHYDEAIPKAL